MVPHEEARRLPPLHLDTWSRYFALFQPGTFLSGEQRGPGVRGRPGKPMIFTRLFFSVSYIQLVNRTGMGVVRSGSVGRPRPAG